MFNCLKTSVLKSGGGKIATRSSNLEALRIVAMTMILMHHFLRHAITPDRIPLLYPLINSLFFSGVNIFFLISGHFGIKLSLRSVVKFVIMVVFFRLVNIAAMYWAGVGPGMFQIVSTFVWPISNEAYWFISVYFLLMLSSPLINAGLKSLERDGTLGRSLLIFTAVLIYMRGNHASFAYLNGAWIYCLGYWLRRADVASMFSRSTLLAVFFAACAMESAGNLVFAKTVRPDYGFYDYENLFIVVSSVAMYLLFSKFTFQSRAVNSLAGAALGCYLLQDGQFGGGWFYSRQGDFFDAQTELWPVLAMFAVSFAGYWIVSWGLTRFMNVWLRPLTESVCGVIAAVSRPIARRVSVAR